MVHDQLVQKAKEAIENLFNDISVGPETTKGDLEALVEDIEMKIEAIKCDLDFISG